MVQCRQLTPCFPKQVVHSLSSRDRSLYVLFHVLLWASTVAFFACLVVYAIERNYLYFILPLPCIILMFVGLFGFRWLAIRNNDKFQLPSDRRPSADAESPPSAGNFPPPPPTYSTDYDGPIFTIFGSLAPPPTYNEATLAAASVTSVTSANSAMTVMTTVTMPAGAEAAEAFAYPPDALPPAYA